VVPAIRPIARRLAAPLLLATLLGCPRKRSPEDDLRGALTTADVAWRDRGTGGLPAVGAALDAAEALAPGHPEIAWRRVRLGVAIGLSSTDDVDALRAYSAARATGLVCIAGESGIGSGFDQALRRLDQAHSPCVPWTALAWVRWLEVFGSRGAALDLARIDLLIAASAVDPTEPGPHDHVAAWAEGILAALRTDAPDLDLAEERLRSVAESSGDDVIVFLDWLRLVAEPRGDATVTAGLTETLREADLDTPEERGAVGSWRTRSDGAP